MTFAQWLDVLVPEDPRTCSWCLGADGWWEDYTVPVECDPEPDQGLICRSNVYVMWMPCPSCSEAAGRQLEFDFSE